MTPFVPTTDLRPTLYLGADGDFGNHPTPLYFGLAETAYRSGVERGQADAGPPIVVWEYWSGGGWTPRRSPATFWSARKRTPC